jgi:LysM repeat protein
MYNPTRAEIDQARRMKPRAALRVSILMSCGLLLTACGGRKDSVVPAATPAQPPAASQMHIVVQRGQTLDTLAERFHVDKAEIIALNNLKPPYRLKPGAVLQIPVLPAGLEQEEQTVEPPMRSAPPARSAVATPKPTPSAADPAPAQPAKPKRQPRPKTPPEVIPLD